MTRWTRHLAIPTLLLALGSIPAPARGQEPEVAVEGEDEGDPFYGYLGTAALCFAAIFAVCKSARR